MSATDRQYLYDIELRRDFEFHLYDVVCKHCRRCLSGSHEWKQIDHAEGCPLLNSHWQSPLALVTSSPALHRSQSLKS